MRKYDLTVNDKSFSITVRSFTTERAELEIRGTLYNVRIDDVVSDDDPRRPAMRKVAPASQREAAAPKPARADESSSLLAPIPGQVLELLVNDGDTVTAGQPVLKMEAMKMENVITAHRAGKVTSIAVKRGDAVSQGQELLTIE